MKIAVFVVICFLFSFAIAEDTLVCSELEVDTDLDQPINGNDGLSQNFCHLYRDH